MYKMRIVSLADKIDNGHIEKMDGTKRKHNGTRHIGNAGYQFAWATDGFPEPDHQCHIAKVK